MKTLPVPIDPAKDRFLRACRRRPVDRVPVWFMRQAGRYMAAYRGLREKHSILELARTPELACEVTLQPVRAMGMDAAILFSDILIVAKPLGIRMEFAPGPKIDNPIRSFADVRRLMGFEPAEELAFVGEAVRLVVRELGGRVPLIGFAGAPFTVASYLIEGGGSKDYLRTKNFMNAQPAAWDALLGKLGRVTEGYLRMQVAAGASAVQLFDSWAGVLTPEQYRRQVLPHSRRLLSALKGLGVPVIHFGTGTAGFLSDFASAGGDVVGVDSRVELGAAFASVGPRAVQGNLDPAFLFGPRPVLKSEIRRLLSIAGRRRGYIFNLGHGVLPKTPEENVRAAVDLVHAFRP